MEEIWGKEIEKLIQKEVWIKYPIITLVQIFCKDYLAVLFIMQTSVRGTSSNDPAVSEFNWERAFTPGVSSNFVVAQSHTWWERRQVKANEKSSRKVPKLRER